MSSVMPPLDLHDDAFAPVPPADQQVAQLRVPPHSMESESSVLGGLLLDNNAWERVGDLLSESDFYRHEHKLIYDAIGKLVNAGQQRLARVLAVNDLFCHNKNLPFLEAFNQS